MSLFPFFIKLADITQRFTLAPIVKRVYPINLIIYTPTVLLIILWISSLEDKKIRIFKFEKIRFKIGKIIYLKYLIPLAIIVGGFFLISKNAVYQGRMITGLFSALMFITPLKLFVAYKSKGLNVKVPSLIKLLLILIGSYRMVTLLAKDNIWNIL